MVAKKSQICRTIKWAGLGPWERTRMVYLKPCHPELWVSFIHSMSIYWYLLCVITFQHPGTAKMNKTWSLRSLWSFGAKSDQIIRVQHGTSSEREAWEQSFPEKGSTKWASDGWVGVFQFEGEWEKVGWVTQGKEKNLQKYKGETNHWGNWYEIREAEGAGRVTR